MNVENIEKNLRKPLLVAILYIVISFAGGLGMVLTHGMPQPVIHDEFSYLLMADTFAAGRLANPPHPAEASFHTFHVIHHGVYASKYFPGPGVQLLLGRFMGSPIFGVWLTMSFWALGVWWLLRRWFSGSWAFLGGTLLLLQWGWCSYFGQSYWGGSLFGLGGTLVLGGLVRLDRTPGWTTGWLLALGLTVILLTRPFEGFFLCSFGGLWLLSRLWSKRTEIGWALWFRRGVLPPILGVLTGLGLLATYNQAVTGDFAKFPHRLYDEVYFANIQRFPWQEAVAGEPEVKELPGPMAMMRANYPQLIQTIRDRFWEVKADSIGAWLHFFVPWWWLPLVLVGLGVGLVRREAWLWFVLLVLLGRLPPILLSLSSRHPHYGAPWGVLVLIFLVAGAAATAGYLAQHGWKRGVILPAALMLGAGLLVYGFSLDPMRATAWKVNTSYAANWMTYRQLIEWHLGNDTEEQHLVLVRYGPKHVHHAEWVYNSADIDQQDVVWAHFRTPEINDQLITFFEDRTVWVVIEDGFEKPVMIFAYDEIEANSARDRMPEFIGR